MAKWEDPPAAGRGVKGVWLEILEPLMRHPGRWAKIKVCDSPEQSWDVSDNLRRRLVIIPRPSDNWEFVSRGSEVFAKYGGRKRASVRRTQRKR